MGTELHRPMCGSPSSLSLKYKAVLTLAEGGRGWERVRGGGRMERAGNT